MPDFATELVSRNDADARRCEPGAAALDRPIAKDHPVARRWVTDDELAAEPGPVRATSGKPPAGRGRARPVEVEGSTVGPRAVRTSRAPAGPAGRA